MITVVNEYILSRFAPKNRLYYFRKAFYFYFYSVMNSFKDLAYDILLKANKSLHYKDITNIALKQWLVTDGKTPEATMNAQLIVDINSKKELSRFIKTWPWIFAINDWANHAVEKKVKEEKQPLISKSVSTKQKGDIAEARIAELITLYGETELSCYRPISDDEWIDLIVKEKWTLRTMYFQIKSRFTTDVSKIFTATVKKSWVLQKYSMWLIFCDFDISTGDLRDYVRYIPAPDFIKYGNDLQDHYGFVAGRWRKEDNKRDMYLIEKRDLANKIVEDMKKLS